MSKSHEIGAFGPEVIVLNTTQPLIEPDVINKNGDFFSKELVKQIANDFDIEMLVDEFFDGEEYTKHPSIISNHEIEKEWNAE